MLADWLRLIRIRFLLSSVLGVTVGIGLTFFFYNHFNFLYAILTYLGVISLHASVDILNDYWDYKRGIDQITKRTKFSGGTGVLIEKKISPEKAKITGLIFFIIGLSIGSYFVVVVGFEIAIILGFAALSVYFYSSKIVNFGLGELFVGIKGSLIVIGSSFVQIHLFDPVIIYSGMIIGMLSSMVLFIASFPDYEADKKKGRKSLLILLNKKNGRKIFPFFFVMIYFLILFGIFPLNLFPAWVLLTFLPLPLPIKAMNSLYKNDGELEKLESSINLTVLFSRIFCIIFIISFFLSFHLN